MFKSVTCACGAIVFIDESGGLCESCPAEYNRHGRLVNAEVVKDERLTPRQAEDRAYMDSGLDNLWDMSNEEIDKVVRWI